MTEGGIFKGKKITYHDSCYIGRANGIYEAPRSVLAELDAELVEMKRCKTNGLCCGAGGAQMFKEPEKGNKDINVEIEKGIKISGKTLAMKSPYGIKSVPTRFTFFGKKIAQEPITNSNAKGEFSYGPYIFFDSVPVLLEARLTNFKSKENKDWGTSDKIRDELQAAGIQIKDGKDGATYSVD